MKFIRSYLLAGLVVWLPILVTLWVLHFLVDTLDGLIALIPVHYQPQHWLGVNIPGLGVIFALAILCLTGLVATNVIGQWLFGLGERLLEKIPLVRTIYVTVKQVIQAVFSSNSQAFRQVVLVEYPQPSTWTMGFLTGKGPKEAAMLYNEPMVSVFIPTTPNPTSGFLVMVPSDKIKPMSMSVDEGLKYIVSLGVMVPSSSSSSRS